MTPEHSIDLNKNPGLNDPSKITVSSRSITVEADKFIFDPSDFPLYKHTIAHLNQML
jgi:hypothetical protein